jgi:transcription antitermination protein NusB
VTSRREARRTAIEILYQADVTAEDPRAVLEAWSDAGREVGPFTTELVAGVREHRPELDDLLDRHSEGWSVERMAVLDRTILRVAVFELLHRPDVPPSAAISEAVEAASELSAEASSRFVNGILGRIAGELPAPAADPDAPTIR